MRALPRWMPAAVLAEGARFLGTGLVLFPLGLGVSALLHDIVGLRPEAATAIAIGVMLLTGFVMARNYIFCAPGDIRRQLPRFLLVSCAMRGAEYVLFLLLFQLARFNYLVAMALALGTSSLLKFVFYRSWVFGRPLVDAAGKPGS